MLLMLFILSAFWLMSQNAWINEFHYDDAGGDTNEVIEIVIENPTIFSLSDFSVYLYNGSNGETYGNNSVDIFTEGDTEGNYTIYYWLKSGIQNGAPDGLALVYDGSVISGQFLSYEGSFSATNGPATGLTSVDIGVSEGNGTLGSESLQLSGNGSQYADFIWQPPAQSTRGSLNNNQSFVTNGNQAPSISNILIVPIYPTSSETVAVSAEVTDDNSVTSVLCQWGTTDGGPYPNSIAMSLDMGDTYSTDDDIPVQPDGSVVYFVVEATDDELLTTTSPEENYVVRDPETTSLPYSQTFDSDLGNTYPFNAAGASLFWTWSSITKENSGHAYMFGLNGTNPEEDWLILPGINLDNYSDEILQFYSWERYGSDDADNYLKLLYSTNYSGTGDPTAASWTELSFNKPGASEIWASSGLVDLSGITGAMVYIGFKYYSTNDPKSWRIDDVNIFEGSLVNVTFQVNMQNEIVSGNGVHIAGSFNGWQADATQMFDGDSDDIYSTTLQLYTDVEYQFKFINGNAWGLEETVPGDCQAPGTTNRFEIIGDTDYFIDAFCFGSCSSCASSPIVINEIHADPDAANGDANGDGTISSSQDEFVELVNASPIAIDMSYYTISDGIGLRHTFPQATILQPNDGLVVFGGGEPAGFEYYEVQTASTGTLGLNNSGDDLVVKDSFGNTVAFYTYGSEAGNNQSITRDPDITGGFVEHTTAAGSGGSLYSPGKFIDANWFKAVTVWDGSEGNNLWDDDDNWSNNSPTASSRATIPRLMDNYPSLTAPGKLCNSLLIESDASFTGVDNLSVNGFSTIHRTINQYTGDDDGFHFLSSPVSSFRVAGSGFEPVSGSDDLYAWDEADNKWINYFGGNFSDTAFYPAKGYLVAYASANNGVFYGPLNNTAHILDLSYTAGQGEGWNLLGNPYPSAIDWDLLAKSSDVYGSVYVLRGSDNTYVSYNGSTGDLINGEIPINNGFFVKAGSTGQSITVEPSNQVHGSGFLKKDNLLLPDNTLCIAISHENLVNNTYIQFRDDASFSFDQSMDAYKLLGSSRGPQLFTTLAEIDYSINSIPFPEGDFKLPLGFTTESEGEYTISSEGLSTISKVGFEIYLEDIATGQLINLGTENYTFEAETEGNRDRFLLYFNGATTIGKSLSREAVRIYTGNNEIYVRFGYMPQQTSIIEVYNVIGQPVHIEELDGREPAIIQLDKPPGIYIVRLKFKNSYLIQKVLLK